MELGKSLQLLVEYVTEKFDTVWREVVLYAAVDGILVYTLTDQFAEDNEDIGVIAVVGEKASVGGKSNIKSLCPSEGERVKSADLLDNAEDKFTCA